MITDIGEYFVGAYLQLVDGCDVVDYNVRPPGGGVAGLGELDVIGLNFKTNTAYLCEVTTHIRGLLYKSNTATVVRIITKHERQQLYAHNHLRNFSHKFQLWSPVVPVGYITEQLGQVSTLDAIINHEYTSRVRKLQELAASYTHDARNPVFRVLQVLAHLRE